MQLRKLHTSKKRNRGSYSNIQNMNKKKKQKDHNFSHKKTYKNGKKIIYKFTQQQGDNHLHNVVDDDQFAQPIQTFYLLSHNNFQKTPFLFMNLIF